MGTDHSRKRHQDRIAVRGFSARPVRIRSSDMRQPFVWPHFRFRQVIPLGMKMLNMKRPTNHGYQSAIIIGRISLSDKVL
jgi:hypothetical protein